jgi:hypothetical protein
MRLISTHTTKTPGPQGRERVVKQSGISIPPNKQKMWPDKEVRNILLQASVAKKYELGKGNRTKNSRQQKYLSPHSLVEAEVKTGLLVVFWGKTRRV